MDTILAGKVILSGLVIVFVALIFLTLFLMVFGRLMSGISKKSGLPPTQKVQTQQSTVQQPKAPIVQDGISDETIAVISAAVAASLGSSHFVLRNVKRATQNSARPAWCVAGMQQNTNPFL